MKKSIFCLFLLALTFVACKKDPTLEDQLVGTWQSTNITIGGADATQFNSIELIFEESLEFESEMRTTGFSGEVVSAFTGDWTTDEAKQEVILLYDSGDSEKYDVTELTQTRLRATAVIDGVRREITFSKK
jgi:hypothetical protein